jgi:hypothetical protein
VIAAIRVSHCEDIVTLRMARGGVVLPVMRVLMGGMASRNDLPIDRLDDLQLAVETLLAEEPETGSELVLELSASGGGFRVRLDGLENESVKAALLTADPFQPCEGCLLDVRLFLDSLVESYRVVDTTPASYAVVLEKQAS